MYSSNSVLLLLQTCKRKILEGTGHEVVEPKRMKKTASADKENVADSVVKSVVKVEKDPKSAVPASIKKAKMEVPPGFNHVTSLKVTALREELRQRNLDTTGLKKDLQKRLLKAIEEEDSKKRGNKSVVKSDVKAKKKPPLTAGGGDGDVQMKDSETCTNKVRRDSSKMDIDEDVSHSPVKPSAKKKEAAMEATVAKSFLKSTAELFSPSKIAAKLHSSKKERGDMDVSLVVEKVAIKKLEDPESGRKPLKEGLKKTASAILSASPVRKAPVSQLAKYPFLNGSASQAKTMVKTQEASVKEDAPVE